MKYLNTVPTRGLNLIKSWLRPGFILLSMLFTLGVGEMWAGAGYNDESHVYLNVDGTTKYYKVSTESWSTGSTLPGTWGGVLKDQTFSNIHTLEIKGGAVGGWTDNGGSLSGTMYYKITANSTTPTSGWTSFGSIATSTTTKNGNNLFYYKNNGSTNVTPHTAGTYYLHIKITDGASNNRTSYVKFTIPSYTVAGNITILGSDWSTTDTNNDMTWSSGTTYTLTKSDVSLTKNNTYEYKVALNHAWGTSYPASNASIDFGNTTGHYNVTFTFNASTHAVSATATRIESAITLNSNGGSANGSAKGVYLTGTTLANLSAPTKNGYKVVGYYKEAGCTNLIADAAGNLQASTDYTNSSKQWNTTTAAVTLYAKWEEDLSSNCYLKGDFDSWGDGVNMTKHTGESTGTVVYCTRDFTASNTPTKIKIMEGPTWYGAQDAVNSMTKNTGSSFTNIWTLATPGNNINFYPSITGTYTFKYDYSTHKLQVYYPVVYQLQVFSASPADATNTNNFDWDSHVGNVYTKTLSLNANTTYEFKCVVYSDFYGNIGEMTATDHSNWDMSIDVANCRITTQVAGDYVFAFTYTGSGVGDTKRLTVTYPTAYTITYGAGTINGSNSAISVSPSFTSGDYVAAASAVTFSKGTTKAGYTWKGWYSNANGSGTLYSSTNGSWTSAANSRTGNISVYACYTLNNYTATLSTTGKTGYGSGAPANQSVTYTQNMPTITPPTAASGYAFMGYWDNTNGSGTQYYKADGTSAHVWDKTSDATLHAYFKKAEITDITLHDAIMDPVPSETGTEADYVLADPVISPTPTPTVTVTWRMLYSDGTTPVPGRTSTAYTEGGTKPFQVKFDIVGMVAGVYKIEAVLKTGGTTLSTYQKVFRIANDYTVTIKYMCGEEEIKERITQPGNPVDWQDVTAPDIFGYKFLRWNPGDGITLESANTTKDNRYRAEYDSKLTAYYTKEQFIYLDLSQQFSSDGKWSDPYVYFYSANPWNNTYGVGASGHSNYISGHAMTQIGSTGIWYYDYSGVSGACNYVAFTWGDKTSQDNFNYTDVIFRGDFSDGTPLFVPATDGSVSSRKETKNNAQYYNKGYWVNYVGPKTGYTMLIYNSAGNVELKRELFISEDKHVPMTASVELDATTTYQIEVYRNNGHYYQHTNGNFTTSSRGPKPLNGSSKSSIKTNAAGSYTFTLGYSSGNLQLSVNYPASTGDFRVIYTDNDTWGRGVVHVAESWYMTSHILPHEANRVDTVSFFISKDHSPEIKWQKITTVAESSISWGTTTGTCSDWLSTGYTDVAESGVYNFKVTQNADGSQIASIERIGKYEGNYYIRCGALNSKWDHYTTDEDHLMTYSAFSESEENTFGEKYSHYKTKWCERRTNIKFCIANDYSPSISDTLLYDNPNSFDNVESDGRLKTDNSSDPTADRYSANVRFMWNRHTNKISRAYVASATNVAKRFLVLVGTDGLKDKDGNAIAATANLEANAVLLHDDQNWIYETYIRAVPGTLVKLYASYAQASPNPNGSQYFRGSYGAFDEGHTIQILGGEGSTPQRMRVIYDFKTNRLVTAWLPGATIDGNLEIEADVMIIRDHQKDAECITFANKGSKLSEVKTVYGVLQFNRWTLNNRRRGPGNTVDEIKEHCIDDETIAEYHPLLSGVEQLSVHERANYFISFPFDVNLSDVFGFGTYGEQWIISRYNGLRRAQQGFFADHCFNDDCTNWDYIHSYFGIDHNSFTLKANEGYLLSLDLSQMEYDDTTHFWLNQIHNVELFFPSAVPLATIENTTATIDALPSTYQCNINNNTDGLHPEKDHTKKDSYWRCIGVPSFANYDGSLSNPETSSTIVWQSHPSWEIVEGNLPFFYEWNTTDNSLMPRATTNYNFRSTFSYLVQCSTAIYWSAVVGKKPASIVSRQYKATKEYNWRLTLEKNGEVEDQTFIRMADNEFVTENFDFNQDLIKEQKYNHANIYSFIGTDQVAANSIPLNTETTTIVPIGITIWYPQHAGDYVFSLPDGADGVGITLVDNENGARTNLSAGMDYSVHLEKGEYTNRFHLEIAKIKNTATGIETGEVINSKDGARKVLIDGQLYIIRDGKVYDARGNKVE